MQLSTRETLGFSVSRNRWSFWFGVVEGVKEKLDGVLLNDRGFLPTDNMSMEGTNISER